ncbi:MAG: hypothetical protein ACTTJ6_02545 [Treponema sp.]
MKKQLVYVLIFSFLGLLTFSCIGLINISARYVVALHYDDGTRIEDEKLLESLKITMIEKQKTKYECSINYKNNLLNSSGQYEINIRAGNYGAQYKYDKARLQFIADHELMGARIEDPSGTYKTVEIYPFTDYVCVEGYNTQVIKVKLEKK